MTHQQRGGATEGRRKGKRMDVGTWVIVGLALLLIVIAYRRGDSTLSAGLRSGWASLLEFLPLLVSLFIIIGLADQLLPRQVIAGWLGRDSGLKGILIASGVGMLIVSRNVSKCDISAFYTLCDG